MASFNGAPVKEVTPIKRTSSKWFSSIYVRSIKLCLVALQFVLNASIHTYENNEPIIWDVFTFSGIQWIYVYHEIVFFGSL